MGAKENKAVSDLGKALNDKGFRDELKKPANFDKALKAANLDIANIPVEVLAALKGGLSGNELDFLATLKKSLNDKKISGGATAQMV